MPLVPADQDWDMRWGIGATTVEWERVFLAATPVQGGQRGLVTFEGPSPDFRSPMTYAKDRIPGAEYSFTFYCDPADLPAWQAAPKGKQVRFTSGAVETKILIHTTGNQLLPWSGDFPAEQIEKWIFQTRFEKTKLVAPDGAK
jgi:hypothetical protein